LEKLAGLATHQQYVCNKYVCNGIDTFEIIQVLFIEAITKNVDY